jgi:hypothetical protein
MKREIQEMFGLARISVDSDHEHRQMASAKGRKNTCMMQREKEEGKKRESARDRERSEAGVKRARKVRGETLKSRVFWKFSCEPRTHEQLS